MQPLLAEPLSPLSRAESCAGLSVVVPCFNEVETLPRLAQGLATLELALQQQGMTELEVILVDDGSTDGTWEALKEQFADQGHYRLVQHAANRGIAAAIATGIQAAKFPIVASIDADCSYDPCQLLPMLSLMTDGVAMVVASPYHPQGKVNDVPPWRLGISKIASGLYRLALRQKLYTYTSCFRIYRQSVVAPIEIQEGGFVGIAELVWRLDRAGHRIVECPAVLDVRQTGHSKMKVVRATCKHLGLLFKASADRIFHRPAAKSLINPASAATPSLTPID